MSKLIRLFGSVTLLLLFAFIGLLITPIPFSIKNKRKVRILSAHYFARALLWWVNVKVYENSSQCNYGGYLVVANHTSVLDAIVLMARRPSVFVTSVETEETPVIGFLARAAGVIFVERRSRLRIVEDQQQVRRALLQGFDVVLFPEGTSTNGKEVLRFKSGLFPAATEICAPIKPIAIEYISVNGEVVSSTNDHRVYYYGNHRIQDHLLAIFTNREVSIQLYSHQPMRTSSRLDVKAVASECYQLIQLSLA